MPLTHLARVCWNTARWTRPTGEAAGLEDPNSSYCAKHGFGHEEWLFEFGWLVDGWKYGFLQPVNNAFESVTGTTIHVGLYTIAPDRTRYYVGEIRNCEVLTEDQAGRAVDELEARGCLREMRAQLKTLKADVSGLDQLFARHVFNVRFRPSDAIQFDRPIASQADTEKIRRTPRYKLLRADDASMLTSSAWPPTRGAAICDLPTGARERAGVAPTTYDLQHNAMQNELAALLRASLGDDRVLVEDDHADLKVIADDGVRIIELKTDPVPGRAIREALGQLLAYAYSCCMRNENVIEIIVAGPGETTDQDRAFVAHLNDRHGLSVRYAVWRRGETSFDLRLPADHRSRRG